MTEADESGPFCPHWDDPADCTEACIKCKHQCRRHLLDGCDEDGCGCEEVEVE